MGGNALTELSRRSRMACGGISFLGANSWKLCLESPLQFRLHTITSSAYSVFFFLLDHVTLHSYRNLNVIHIEHGNILVYSWLALTSSRLVQTRILLGQKYRKHICFRQVSLFFLFQQFSLNLIVALAGWRELKPRTLQPLTEMFYCILLTEERSKSEENECKTENSSLQTSLGCIFFFIWRACVARQLM